ncbi:uncharacterized protein LOC119876620 isoform X1 [Canis lupus familiaris]|uniref:uncharacterized protein LOC119876620 isoform X1 n=1 Tax=Canis lupus familiaris TaxID=9615 RepID=UPI0015F168E6|nr:uncharacterized protein LOC119876620 isoform X1 [Canis lupus familiaris]
MLGSSLYFPPPASRSYDGAWGGVPPDLSLTCPAVLAHPQGTGLPWSHRTPSDSLRMGRGGWRSPRLGCAGWQAGKWTVRAAEEASVPSCPSPCQCWLLPPTYPQAELPRELGVVSAAQGRGDPGWAGGLSEGIGGQRRRFHAAHWSSPLRLRAAKAAVPTVGPRPYSGPGPTSLPNPQLSPVEAQQLGMLGPDVQPKTFPSRLRPSTPHPHTEAPHPTDPAGGLVLPTSWDRGCSLCGRGGGQPLGCCQGSLLRETSPHGERWPTLMPRSAPARSLTAPVSGLPPPCPLSDTVLLLDLDLAEPLGGAFAYVGPSRGVAGTWTGLWSEHRVSVGGNDPLPASRLHAGE